MCADTGLTGFRRNRRPTEGVADRLLPRIRPREYLHGIVAAIGIKLLDAPVAGRLAVLDTLARKSSAALDLQKHDLGS
jgi:hypothetical protein